MLRAILTGTVLLSTLVFPTSATVHVVELQPDGDASKDAGIWEAVPDGNYGNRPDTWVGRNGGYTVTLIKFNGLEIYSGAIVIYAELNLYTDWELGSFGNDNWVDRIDSPWDESTVTWENAPGYDGNIYERFDAPIPYAWLKIDVSAIVQSWLNGSYTHRGFYLYTTQNNYGGVYFCTGELGFPDVRPYLYMEYTYTGVQPASVGEIKAVFR